MARAADLCPESLGGDAARTRALLNLSHPGSHPTALRGRPRCSFRGRPSRKGLDGRCRRRPVGVALLTGPS
jgi:hypothetical protein